MQQFLHELHLKTILGVSQGIIVQKNTEKIIEICLLYFFERIIPTSCKKYIISSILGIPHLYMSNLNLKGFLLKIFFDQRRTIAEHRWPGMGALEWA